MAGEERPGRRPLQRDHAGPRRLPEGEQHPRATRPATTCCERSPARSATAGRDSDLVFRYGGDEFAFLLPGTDAAGALRVAERARAAVKSAGGSVTASVGVSTFPVDGATARDVLLAADRACFVAKHDGRDRVATAAEGPGPVRGLQPPGAHPDRSGDLARRLSRPPSPPVRATMRHHRRLMTRTLALGTLLARRRRCWSPPATWPSWRRRRPVRPDAAVASAAASPIVTAQPVVRPPDADPAADVPRVRGPVRRHAVVHRERVRDEGPERGLLEPRDVSQSLDPESSRYDPNTIQVGWTLRLIPNAEVDPEDLPPARTPSPTPAASPSAEPVVTTGSTLGHGSWSPSPSPRRSQTRTSPPARTRSTPRRSRDTAATRSPWMRTRRAEARRAAFDAMDGLLLSGGADLHPSRYGQPVDGSVDIEPDRDALEAEAWSAAIARVRADPGPVPRAPGHQRVQRRDAAPARARATSARPGAAGPATTHPIRLVPASRLARIVERRRPARGQLVPPPGHPAGGPRAGPDGLGLGGQRGRPARRRARGDRRPVHRRRPVPSRTPGVHAARPSSASSPPSSRLPRRRGPSQALPDSRFDEQPVPVRHPEPSPRCWRGPHPRGWTTSTRS